MRGSVKVAQEIHYLQIRVRVPTARFGESRPQSIFQNIFLNLIPFLKLEGIKEGCVAQLVAQETLNFEVVGSSPTTPIQVPFRPEYDISKLLLLSG